MYEIPTELKNLYRHWENHTNHSGKDNPVTDIELNKSVLDKIQLFASERMHIWKNRFENKRPPYTKDKILENYRFCNIYRELDRQTIEIHTLLRPLQEDFDLWLLNLFLLRFVCNTSTVREVGFLSYERDNNTKVYQKLVSKLSPKYGSAYVFPISIIQKSKHPTRESFFCLYLPTVMKKVSKEVCNFNNLSVVDAVEKVVAVLGFGFRFHVTEVMIDVAYQYPEYVNLFDRFPIGPGSMPTMKRLSEKEPEETCLALSNYKMSDFPYLTYNNKPVLLSAENWEGIGCEFRKYTNLSLGQGRKRKYMPLLEP